MNVRHRILLVCIVIVLLGKALLVTSTVSADHTHLIIYSVATTLVRESPEGIKRAVREAIRLCEGKASLVLFTSNEILPDVPLENMQALYEALREE